MKIVVDTNRIIAATVRDGISRYILFSEKFDLLSPEYTISEIEEHRKELTEKTGLDGKEFDILLSFIMERVMLIPVAEYEKCIGDAKTPISDPDDVPFLALCLALKADGIWTDDKHFMGQQKVRVFRTV